MPSNATPAPAPPDLKSSLRATLLRGFIVPVLLLGFYLVAPVWLNSKVHSQIAEAIHKSTHISSAEQNKRIAALDQIDFSQLVDTSPPDLIPLRDNLEQAGVLADFRYLRWGLWLSVALNLIIIVVVGATVTLNRLAGRSPDALIRHYRNAWRLGMIAAFAQVLLLVPLLTYGVFETTVLAADRYFPKILILLVIGGGAILWRTIAILLKAVPMEFEEPMARAVTPEEAPGLWQAVRQAAARLQTAPPDHIIVGLQMNFYVTELTVKHTGGRAEGRILFLSEPLLKQLSPDEVLAIIGHELGHFIGEDTRLTREFYPFRQKVQATLFTLGQSGPTGWTSFQSLWFFHLSFSATEQEHSRRRELLADRKAAELTSPAITACALVKFHIVHEAHQIGFAAALRDRAQNALDLPLPALIRDQLLPKASFWTELFEKKSPHPLDSHPTLHVRLESLGQAIGPDDAKVLAVMESESAFARWLSGREELFTEIHREAAAAVDTMRARVEVTTADAKSEEGRKLLETHFPEARFPGRNGRVYTFCVLAGVIIVGLSLMAWYLLPDGWRVLGIFGALLIGLPTFILWQRYHHSELVLTVEGLAYTAWRRPLRFEEVESLTAQNVNSVITFRFKLKGKQSPFWRYPLLNFPRKSLVLSLEWIAGKQVDVAQCIYRYYNRELEG